MSLSHPLVANHWRNLSLLFLLLLFPTSCDLWRSTPEELRGYDPAQQTAQKFANLPDTKGVLVLAAGEPGPTMVWVESKKGGDSTAMHFKVWNGKGWSDGAVALPVPPSATLISAIRDEKQHLHVLWLYRQHGQDRIRLGMIATFADGKWGEPLQIYKGAASVYFPTMVLGAENTVHLAWAGVIDHNSAVLYRTLKDGKLGKLHKIALPDNSATFWQPSLVAAKDGRVHMAYTRMEFGKASVVYQTADRHGEDWSQPTPLPKLGARNELPKIALNEDDEPQVFFFSGKHREDIGWVEQDGKDWSDPVIINKREGNPLYMVAGTDSKGRTHLGWMETTVNGRGQSVHLISGKGGEWAEPITLPLEEPLGYGIQTVVQGNALFVTWKGREDKKTPTGYWQRLMLSDGGKE